MSFHVITEALLSQLSSRGQISKRSFNEYSGIKRIAVHIRVDFVNNKGSC